MNTFDQQMKRRAFGRQAAAGTLSVLAVMWLAPTTAHAVADAPTAPDSSITAPPAAPSAAPVAALPAAPDSAPEAAPVVRDFARIFTDITASEQNLTPDGELHVTEGVIIVGGALRVPAAARAGETIELGLDNGFAFRSFKDLEIRTPDGTLIATASATASRLTVSLADGVDRLQDVTGTFTVTVRGEHLFEAVNSQVLNLIAPNGQLLGPGSSHTMQQQLPNATGMLLSTGIASGNEIGVTAMVQYSPQGRAKGPLDPGTVKFTVESRERDAVVNADYRWSYRFIDSAGLLMSTAAPGVTGTAVAKRVSSKRVVLTLPAGVQVPEGAVGVRLSAGYVVGKPSAQYHFAHKVEAMGDTPVDTFNNLPENTDANRDSVYRSTIRSAKLDGAADGVLRPARTSITKEVTSDTSRLMAGDTASYEIVTTNEEASRAAIGVVTTDILPDGVEVVSVSDLARADGRRIVWPAVDLAGGETSTRTVEVRVTEKSAEPLRNEATNTGVNTCFAGDTTGSVCAADASVPVVKPGLETIKTVAEVQDTNQDGARGNAGDTIVYDITAKNTGNTTEESIMLTDELLGLEGQECLAEPLPAGEQVSCIGDFEHIITEADEKAGEVHNIATLQVPGIDPVPGEVTEKTAPTPEPAAEQPRETSQEDAPKEGSKQREQHETPLAMTGGEGLLPLAGTAASLLGAAGGLLAFMAWKRKRAAAGAEGAER